MQSIAHKTQVLHPPKRIISLHNRKTLRAMIFLNNWLIYGKITLRDFVCCRQRTFGLPPSICKLSRLGVRLEMHVSTKSQIRHIMSGLSETRHHLLHDRVVALAASRWMMPVNDNAIIQIELMHHDNQAFVRLRLGLLAPQEAAFFADPNYQRFWPCFEGSFTTLCQCSRPPAGSI